MIYKCKNTELVSSSDKTLQPGPVLVGIVNLVLTDPFYKTRRKNDAKHPTYRELSVPDMKETVEAVTDVLRPRCHAAVFCTAEQFATWHSWFAAVLFTQHDDLSSSSSYGLEEIFIASDAPLTFVGHPSYHHSSP